MKSSILVARIMRVIETDGLVGDGVSLAHSFAESVSAVNARLDSVQAAIAAKQVSDAVRLMEEPPRLLDEINTLDFNRLADWEALCERNGWQPPPPLDRTLLEKVLLLSESTEVAEPFLRMYRKAVRTNNNALAVRALRRLAEVDHSQDWETNLVQSEAALQRQLLEAFSAALASGDDEEKDRLAQDILDPGWRNAPQGKVARDVRAYWEEKEARRRDVEGAENLSLLRRCHDENWNRALAASLLQSIDALTENGWPLPSDACDLVSECRRRVAEEIEAEEKENQWKACCEALHGAIQREDTAAIREALAAPDFLDREPPEDLLRDAKRVIEQEEAAKRRKVVRFAIGSLLALMAVLGASGWWLRQKLFSMRCDGEAAKLATLEKGDHAIERIGEALRQLETEDPEVYADPRVNVYIGKLKTMTAKNLARTNEVTALLAELSALNDAHWTNATDAVSGQLARVETLLTGDDTDYRTQWLKFKTAYADHLAAEEEARRNEGTQQHRALTDRMHGLTARLTEIIGKEEQDKDLVGCRAEIVKWREDYGTLLPELADQLTETEKALADAEQVQKNVCEALDKLKTAQAAPDVLEARKALMESYGSFPSVANLKPYPIDVTVVREVMNGTSAEQKRFADIVNAGIAPDDFKTFLKENVSALAEVPAFYSLYGLKRSGDWSENLFAIAKGKKPEFKKLSDAKGGGWLIEGEILDFVERRMTDRIEKPLQDVSHLVIPSVDEIKECVDIAGRTNLTIGQFENEILRLIDAHLQAVNEIDASGKREYLESEKRWGQGNSKFLTKGRYTAWRRVIILDIYFRWLKDGLKLLPPDHELRRWCEKAEDLAQPIRVEGIPEDLSWVCLWERRVRNRNKESVEYLSQLPADWVSRYRRWRSARGTLREIAGWKIESAGHFLFDPRNPYQKKDPDAAIPMILPSVKNDHPLYVLREENERLKLKKALVPQNGAWARTAEVVPMVGEPLFQICADGKSVDASAEIARCTKGIPAEIMKQFAPKMPFFDVSVPNEEVRK